MEKLLGFKWGKSIEDFKLAMTRGHGYSGEEYWDEEENWLVENLSQLQFKSALSVGCGMFREQFSLEKIALEKVIGLEYEADFVDYFHQNNQNPKTSIIKGDARKMPFEDGEFDIAVALFNTLGNIPDSDIVIKEIYRVIKPGGKLVISVWNDDEFATDFRVKTYINSKTWRVAKIEAGQDEDKRNLIIYENEAEFYRSPIFSRKYLEKLVKNNLPDAQFQIVDLKLCRILAITKTG